MPVVRSSAAEFAYEVVEGVEVVVLQGLVRRFAVAHGFGVPDSWRLAIAASEAATNILKFAGQGTISLAAVPGPPAEIRMDARDRGAGFADVAGALRDHVSEGRDLRAEASVQSRRGLGTGLGALSRMLDDVVVENAPGGGAHISGVLRRRG